MLKHCSPGIAATQSIPCGLATFLFWEYYEVKRHGGSGISGAYDPLPGQSHKPHTAQCIPSAGTITCRIFQTTDPRAEVVITQAALDAATPQQANSYERQKYFNPPPGPPPKCSLRSGESTVPACS
jgi:hypothetical protein